jgi:hypothetical protein
MDRDWYGAAKRGAALAAWQSSNDIAFGADGAPLFLVPDRAVLLDVIAKRAANLLRHAAGLPLLPAPTPPPLGYRYAGPGDMGAPAPEEDTKWYVKDMPGMAPWPATYSNTYSNEVGVVEDANTASRRLEECIAALQAAEPPPHIKARLPFPTPGIDNAITEAILGVRVTVTNHTPPGLRLPRGPHPRPVEGLNLSRFPLPMEVLACCPWPHQPMLELRCCMTVRDRDDDRPHPHAPTKDLVFTQSFPLYEVEARGEEATVYEFVRTALLHEFDECWLVNGKRTRDPHRNEWTTTKL